jgi:ankyrin repeat protein
MLEELLAASSSSPSSLFFVDARDAWGHTALHYASLCGHKNAVVSLIQNGAEVSATNDMGHTPLDYAASEEVAVSGSGSGKCVRGWVELGTWLVFCVGLWVGV